MDKQQEIEQLAQAIYDSKIALDGSDYLFGIDGDDHFTKLAMHLVYADYGNIPQALTEFAEFAQEKLISAIENGGEFEMNSVLREFWNERTD